MKSVQLVGAGAGATTIEGGGPVITIGELDGIDQPTVSISRVTITGGLNDSAPVPFAAGGGVWILPGRQRDRCDGHDHRQRHHREPGRPEDDSPLCGILRVRAGGGIDNAGTLTVTNTRITDNVAGSTACGPLRRELRRGRGHPERAPGDADPAAQLRERQPGRREPAERAQHRRRWDRQLRGADGRGQRRQRQPLRRRGLGSELVLLRRLHEANAGGLYLAPASSTTITRSRISGNSVHSTNTAGDASAEAGGIDAEGSLLLTNSSVENNTAVATVPASRASSPRRTAAGSRYVAPPSYATAASADNSLSATSETGAALASGGGLANIGGGLTLERTVVAANSASATGVGGFNLGGGILNVLFGGGPPELTLTDSVITANRLAASDGVLSQGGGLYTADPFTGSPFPVTMTRTLIEGNKPDQCVGC